MNKQLITGMAVIGAIALAAAVFWRNDAAGQLASDAQGAQATDAAHVSKTNGQHLASTAQMGKEGLFATSPYPVAGAQGQGGNEEAQARALLDQGGAAAEKEALSPEAERRRKQMEKLGYFLSPDYYTKDLATIKKLAKGGDAFAMMHLGEKYYFELKDQPGNPEFDPKANYGDLAKEAFRQALVAGNIRSAGIIAELYLQEKNVQDAYAWHLVSAKLGDDISAEWFQKTELAQQASDAVKQAAELQAQKIINEMKLHRKA
ncbi:hypothetical protein KSF73_07295 [Burkholderiaceae bacterium DAT-1]|nr:hypothetical protein [Burkholderiaceae bacterium DAT-1]